MITAYEVSKNPGAVQALRRSRGVNAPRPLR